MTSSGWEREKELFQAALARAPDERAAFLEAACAGDARLRARIDSLLAAHAQAEGFLAQPAAGAETLAAVIDATPDLVGRQIGHFHIRGVLARGGMGIVFEAVQEEPRRTVALKVMRRGIASHSALRRFQYEAQILGRLRHPGIAQVYEAGLHAEGESGLPYFAMEYIPGARPITEHAEQQRLSTRARLALFEQVCDAVHHGHQRGIIHRDLKPANILVDSSGRPKVIDFGVARATDSDLAVTTQQTDIGQLIGTMQYMSPEQCDADPHDLDVRSDVYALGVVLYELLCGRPPYNVSGATIFQATRLIKESPTPRPSSRDRRLRGDIETIVLKALQKDRQQRYQSTAELARDLRRYLNNEPILARPPTVRYQMAKFCSRHWAGVVATVLVTLALIGGAVGTIVGTSRGLVRARRAEAQALAVNRFLEDMLSAVDPGVDGRDVKVAAVLERAAERLGTSFADQPELAITLHQAIGNVYLNLGLYDEAERHSRAALDLERRQQQADALRVADALNALGRCLVERGSPADAVPILEEAHATAAGAADEAHAYAIVAGGILGRAWHALGELERAEVQLRRVVELCRRTLGPENDETLHALNNLALVLTDRGAWEEAESIDRQVLAARRRQLGDAHPLTLTVMTNLAIVLYERGAWEEAESYYRPALAERRRVLGEEHPLTLRLARNLGALLMERGENDEAEALFRATLAAQTQTLGPEHVDTLNTQGNLALLLCNTRQLTEAETLARAALERSTRALGPEHPDTLWAMNTLALILDAADARDEAEQLYERTLDLRRRVFGPEHKWTIISQSNLALFLLRTQQPARAEPLYRTALEICRRTFGDGHRQTLIEMYGLGTALLRLGRYEEAEPLLRGAQSGFERALGAPHVRTRWAVDRLIELYEGWGRPESAAPWRDYLTKSISE